MVDTVRTESDLLTLFADNTSGDISAQDGRDLIKSITQGGYIYANGENGTFAQGSSAIAGGSAAYGQLAQGASVAAGAGGYGNGSFAQGSTVTATGHGSFAQGNGVNASGNSTFAQGQATAATGYAGMFAQGSNTNAEGAIGVFAAGQSVTAQGYKGLLGQGMYILAAGSSGVLAQGNRVTAQGSHGCFAQGYSVSATGYTGCFAQGSDATALGSFGCFAQGATALALANSSWACGSAVLADKIGQHAISTGGWSSSGGAQMSTFVLNNATTNNTPTNLFLDGSSARLTVPGNISWCFDMLIVARDTGNNESAGYRVAGVIKMDGTTCALVGSVTKDVLGEDQAAWDVTVTADDTNDALDIKVTGENSKTIHWVATVRVAEVG